MAGGAPTLPPAATGAPMLPAVLPVVLPPVLWGVTAGISKSPNPSNTWGAGGNGRTPERQHGLQTCKSLIELQHRQRADVKPDGTVRGQSGSYSIRRQMCMACTV